MSQLKQVGRKEKGQFPSPSPSPSPLVPCDLSAQPHWGGPCTLESLSSNANLFHQHPHRHGQKGRSGHQMAGHTEAPNELARAAAVGTGTQTPSSCRCWGSPEVGLWWSGGPQEVGGAASCVIEAPTPNSVQRGRFQLTLTSDAYYWTMQCICGVVNVFLVMLKFWFSLHPLFFFLFFFLYRISRGFILSKSHSALFSYFH